MNWERNAIKIGGLALLLGACAVTDGMLDIENKIELTDWRYAKTVGGIITSYAGTALMMMGYFNRRYKEIIKKD